MIINGRGYATYTVWSCGSIGFGRGCSAVVHAQTEKLSYIHSMYLCVICTCTMHFLHDLREQYRVKLKVTLNIRCAQTRQKLYYDKKHNTCKLNIQGGGQGVEVKCKE